MLRCRRAGNLHHREGAEGLRVPAVPAHAVLTLVAARLGRRGTERGTGVRWASEAGRSGPGYARGPRSPDFHRAAPGPHFPSQASQLWLGLATFRVSPSSCHSRVASPSGFTSPGALLKLARFRGRCAGEGPGQQGLASPSVTRSLVVNSERHSRWMRSNRMGLTVIPERCSRRRGDRRRDGSGRPGMDGIAGHLARLPRHRRFVTDSDSSTVASHAVSAAMRVRPVGCTAAFLRTGTNVLSFWDAGPGRPEQSRRVVFRRRSA